MRRLPLEKADLAFTERGFGRVRYDDDRGFAFSFASGKSSSVSLGGSGIGVFFTAGLIGVGSSSSESGPSSPRAVIVQKVSQVLDNGDFYLLTRQTFDVNIAIEAQRDRTVRSNQPLAGNRPARQRFKDFDQYEIRWLDDIGKRTRSWRLRGAADCRESPVRDEA